MINDIRYHVADDEDMQILMEQQLAAHMHVIYQSNINAFQRNIPSLLPLVTSMKQKNVSVFCNKFGEYNLVDIGVGKVFYGLSPKRETKKHIEIFTKHPVYVPFHNISDSNNSSSWECLVILGCGIGYHIKELLSHRSVRHVIIYEPETQYFAASSKVLDWKDIFEHAKAQDTNLYLQIGKDGRDIVSDLDELQKAFKVSGFYIYKHYHHLIFDQVMQALLKQSWQKLQKEGLRLKLTQSGNEYILPWNEPVASDTFSSKQLDYELKSKNLAAFKRFFPEIYKHFKDYEPKIWRPLANAEGQINLQRISDGALWHGPAPEKEAAEQLKFFAKHPHKDGLVLGYTGNKLLHYEHYKFVKKTEKLLDEATEGEQNLPDVIPSIIMFGMGCGYQLQTLSQKHNIEKLFIVEPNRDFFLASLYAINWTSLLEDVNDARQRIYLNIGDDGSNLVNDLMNQFTNVGPYLLNQTYFFQGYYNARLNEAIANLREQLRIMICMGEFFDHAFYGINHTDAAVAKNARFLRSDHNKYLSHQDKEIPVFIVGNGPSVDSAIETIKEHRNEIILISCGTVLKVLHRNGIIPDFQAEIEQNRTTFDWACLVDAPEYLAQISLLSCNGIHPDTMDLYKDTYLAFKKGESSTSVAFEILDSDTSAEIEYAFPTVSNLVVDFVTTLGFSSAYLFGVDLGFTDHKYHHSRLSSYYKDDGEELYDYSEHNQTSLVVPGNFRKTVFTKLEFKLSKQMIEKRIASGETTFYNCSDGAKIAGTLPLQYDNILILNSVEQRRNCIECVKSKCFSNPDKDKYKFSRQQKFSIENTLNDFKRLRATIEKRFEDNSSIDSLPEDLKNLNFSSYKKHNSLFFYYMYGSVNFFSAALAKIRAVPSETSKQRLSIKILEAWKESLRSVERLVCSSNQAYDTSMFGIEKVENLRLKTLLTNKKCLLVYENTLTLLAFNMLELTADFESIAAGEYCVDECKFHHFDHVIFQFEDSATNSFQLLDEITNTVDLGKVTLLIETRNIASFQRLLIRPNCPNVIVFCSDPDNGRNWRNHKMYITYVAARIIANGHKHSLLVPKLVIREDLDSKYLPDLSQLFNSKDLDAIDFRTYLSFEKKTTEPARLLSPLGTRGKECLEDNSDIVLLSVPKEYLIEENQRAQELLLDYTD